MNLNKKELKEPYFTTFGKGILSCFITGFLVAYTLATIWILNDLPEKTNRLVVFNFWLFSAVAFVSGFTFLVCWGDYPHKLFYKERR